MPNWSNLPIKRIPAHIVDHMDPKLSKYFITRLNEALTRSNIQPTLRDLEKKSEQIARGIRSVEYNHTIIRDNITETKVNLKKRGEVFWKRCGNNLQTFTGDSSDEDESLRSSERSSCVIETKMSGLQIDLSVLSPAPDPITPEEEFVPRDTNQVVSLLTPTSPIDNYVAKQFDVSNDEITQDMKCHQPELRIGTEVLVMRKSKDWDKGTIVHTHSNNTYFNVRGDDFFEKSVIRNKLCVINSVTEVTVGARIVALYGQLGIYYAGVAAEISCQENGNRILVFFDDGFAQYLAPDNVYLVANTVWEEVGKTSKDFIKEYLKLYPRRRMLRLHKGDVITTEWRGKWCKPSVMDVDCSLARVHFVQQNMKEWIYRGSTRFMVLFNLLSIADTTQDIITRSTCTITQMLFDELCPFCIEASDTNTGLMDVTKKSHSIDNTKCEDTEPLEQYTSELTKIDECENSSITLQTIDYEDDLTDENSSSDYDSAEGSDHDSDYTECNTTGTKNIILVETPPLEPQDDEIISEDNEEISNMPITRRKWRNIYKPNFIQAPRVDWGPGTILAGDSLIECQAKYQNAVLFNNHSYTYSSLYDRSLETQAMQDSIDFWLNETSKLELNCKPLIEEVSECDIVAGVSQPFEECILSEHSYSKFSSSNKSALSRKTPNRVTLGDPKTRVFRRITYGDEFIFPDSTFTPHNCGSDCVTNATLQPSLHPVNILSIPIFLGWKRELNYQPHKSKPVHVYYIAPCKRRLRSLDEIEYYIHITNSQTVSIDMFSMDTSIDIQNTFVTYTSPKLFIGDLTLGKERIPIPFINELDTKPLPPLNYTTKRICYNGVNINTNNEFMICCDCTDNCQDKTKCACCLLTAEMSRTKDFFGYQNRRLVSSCGVAIYECNNRCSCSSNCSNRVIQNGIQARLHVFKTENKGWGIKCIDDIPKGAFICTYAGYIYNDELANERGVDFGDDYLAELDYLDVMETKKEGYEPYYGALQEDNKDERDNENIPITNSLQQPTTNPEEFSQKLRLSDTERYMDLQDVILLDSHSESDFESSASEQQLEETVVNDRENILVELADESEALIESAKLGMIEDRFPKEWCEAALKLTNGDVSQSADLLEKADTLLIGSESYSNSNPQQLLLAVTKGKIPESTSELTSEDLPFIAQVHGSHPEQPISIQAEVLVISDEDDWATPVIQDTFFYPHTQTTTPLHATTNTYRNIRSLHSEKGAYVMDAKFVGNIGRYFNHSCQPNIFTHTVFLDTHDLRFPWVAFFAKKRIKANTELTWDYNYEIGSVPNKVLQCLCGMPKCRGRLL